VVDGTDERQVAHALERLLLDPDQRARLGAAGRAWVSEQWTWEHAVRRLQHLLGGV
jgi:phosphatidylinositol alpha-1,6-mannosyltransferase